MDSNHKENAPLLARLTILFIIGLLISFVVWASFAEVDELARGEGKIIPLSKTQIIQSSESGIVQEIAVRLGERVSKGQLLIRLDDTSTSSSLEETQARLNSYRAKIARLDIELSELLTGTYVCPVSLTDINSSVCNDEMELLKIRRENFQKKYDVLAIRIQQKRDELNRANTQVLGMTELLGALDKERKKIAPLVERNLHSELSLIQLDRQIVEQNAELRTLDQEIPLLKSSIQEARLQLEEHEIQFKQEARRERNDTLAEMSVLSATVRGASDRVRRTDILSPVEGEVNTLEVNTIGAFVQPGTAVAGIVPTTEKLLVEAKMSPKDIAFILPGQEAIIKLSAYDFSIFGGVKGIVSNVSADSIVDQDTGDTYYNVRIETSDTQLGKDGEAFDIRIGMIGTVDVLTGRKTVLEYLLKPIIKARSEALTER
ncbi:MAG: HlyD family type I secretion periplasmic adaptor subunit [Gammaproteobacteria bacterium]